MKTKTNELIGAALNYAVAKALGSLGKSPGRCCDCSHFSEKSIQDGAEYRCHLGDLSWCDGWASDHPFGAGVSETYGVHEQCPLKKGTATEAYSTDWALGGPIIEREKIALQNWINTNWLADTWNFTFVHADAQGPTALVAAMRCYVRNKLGDEVDVPDELLKGTK